MLKNYDYFSNLFNDKDSFRIIEPMIKIEPIKPLCFEPKVNLEPIKPFRIEPMVNFEPIIKIEPIKSFCFEPKVQFESMIKIEPIKSLCFESKVNFEPIKPFRFEPVKALIPELPIFKLDDRPKEIYHSTSQMDYIVQESSIMLDRGFENFLSCQSNAW